MGGTAPVTPRFKADRSGKFTYICTIPGHRQIGMEGVFEVIAKAGVEPAAKAHAPAAKIRSVSMAAVAAAPAIAPAAADAVSIAADPNAVPAAIYTTHKHGTKGHQDFDIDKMMDEMPDYYVFNGAVGALTKEHKMTAKVDETVRVYFGVGGPNKISSFHMIGEIFDKVYSEGSISSVKKDVQTTLVAAGGATIGEFKLEYPGSYLLVDHALSRAGKGLVAKIDVTGDADPTVYEVGNPR